MDTSLHVYSASWNVFLVLSHPPTPVICPALVFMVVLSPLWLAYVIMSPFSAAEGEGGEVEAAGLFQSSVNQKVLDSWRRDGSSKIVVVELNR